MKNETFLASVVICTYNRKDLIKQCLESLYNQSYPKNKYEIIMIDSSTDGTGDLIKELSKHSPCRFRYIYQDNIGLSTARNIGINEAKGEIVAFMDDDAEAERDWLKYFVETYGHDDIGCVGGRIFPKFESIPPGWFIRKLWGWVGLMDLGKERKNIERGKIEEYPIGCNISFRKNIFDKVGLFREDLGRINGSLLSYEETEVCDRILLSGYRIIYEPKAVVRHFISKDKITLRYFVKRYYYQGVSEAKVGCTVPKKTCLLKIFTQAIRFLAKRDIHYLFLSFRNIGFLRQSIRRGIK